MSGTDYFPEFPREIRFSAERSGVKFSRLDGWYAVLDRPAGEPAPGAAALLNEGAIAVFKGNPEGEAGRPGRLSPVYELLPGGANAVPTGLVFIRFAEGDSAGAHEKEINRAGYEVAESLAYAPHAAWLRARSGSIADALNRLPELEKVPGVVNIEPQMLRPRALKG
jgi:hypothetical protein